MPTIEFIDLKTKKKFRTDDFRFEVREGRGRDIPFAVAENPSGNESWKIVSQKFFEEFG